MVLWGPNYGNPVADRGGGCPGGLDPPFVPRCRLFNIGPKIGLPSGPPFFACRPNLDPPPLSTILDPPLEPQNVGFVGQTIWTLHYIMGAPKCGPLQGTKLWEPQNVFSFGGGGANYGPFTTKWGPQHVVLWGQTMDHALCRRTLRTPLYIGR